MAGLVGAFNAQIRKASAGDTRAKAFAGPKRNSDGVPVDSFGIPLYGRPAGPHGDVATGRQSQAAAQRASGGLGQGMGQAVRRNTVGSAGPNGGWVPRTRVSNGRELDDIANLIQTYYQPDFNSLDAHVASLSNAQAARAAATAQQRAAIQRELGANNRLADLDLQGTNIQLGNMPQWQKYLADQFGVVLRSGRADLDQVKFLKDFEKWDRDMDKADTHAARLGLMHQTKNLKDQAMSDAKVRGVVESVKDPWSDITFEAGQRAEEITRLDQRSEGEFSKAWNELGTREKQINFDLQSSHLTFQEQRDKLKEREQLLGLEAERAKISKEKAAAAAQSMLADLNMQNAISQGQFFEALAKADADRQKLLWDQWMFYAAVHENNARTKTTLTNPRANTRIGGKAGGALFR